MDYLVTIREVISTKTHEIYCMGEDDHDIEVVITTVPTQMPVLQMPLQAAIEFIRSSVASDIELEYSTVYARFEIVLTGETVVERNSVHFMFDNPYENIVDMIVRWKLEIPKVA